jgi:hypothetical protein
LVPRVNATAVRASSKTAISAGTCRPKSPSITGDRGFESISLHRRVSCEPDVPRVRPPKIPTGQGLGFKCVVPRPVQLPDPAPLNRPCIKRSASKSSWHV